MKNEIENKLRSRTTEELMQDIRTAKNSNEKGSTIVFCLALNVLESRLSVEDYVKFENSL
ncbi:hypothetical protein UFOVP1106_36 [uncultured Caudovirales phage]|uniref:Uncharacterized protein n=1 Tax=uncultured Caudovirales phage TaxID=2100421 RepID=A0A6J5QIT0_9CAUD|nr:hypothetical protein UFOVP1106_36 [uncultured Caudovirales phage]